MMITDLDKVRHFNEYCSTVFTIEDILSLDLL